MARCRVLWLMIVGLTVTDLVALSVDQRHQMVTITGEHATVPITYTLHNDLARPLRITKLHTSCGCGTVRAEPREIPAEGSGTVTLDYQVGERVGRQRYMITVSADSGAEGAIEEHPLHVTIDVPQPFRLSRTVAFWRRGGPAQPIVITITGHPDLPAQILRVDCPQGISAQLTLQTTPADDPPAETAAADARAAPVWRLELAPETTTTARHDKVFLITDSEQPLYQRLPVTVLIK